MAADSGASRCSSVGRRSSDTTTTNVYRIPASVMIAALFAVMAGVIGSAAAVAAPASTTQLDRTSRGTLLGDWSFCSTNSQCANGCCSKTYSNDGRYKCTPLTSFNPSICTGDGSSSLLGDWAFCSTNSQCANGCCSKTYSNDGKYKCTPLSGGFNPSICNAGSTSGSGTTSSSGSGSVLYSNAGSGTYYYDVTGQTCNGDAPYVENQGYPSCTSWDTSLAKTMQQYGTNNIVAVDNRLLGDAAGRAKYCGKQIRVYKNGVEVAGGPFFVWDGCQACADKGGTIIDFSVSALKSIQGDACTVGVVPGLSWQIVDKQIMTFQP